MRKSERIAGKPVSQPVALPKKRASSKKNIHALEEEIKQEEDKEPKQTSLEKPAINISSPKKFLSPNNIQSTDLLTPLKSIGVIPTRSPKENIKINFGSFINERKGTFASDYAKEGKLGSGNFGEVLKVKHKTSNNQRAVKVLNKVKVRLYDDPNNLLAEIEILKKIDHPNIMKIYEFYQDSKNYYIIMELINGKELFDYIVEEENKFTELQIASIMKQILGAVCYAHNNKIVHRDLKPENILVVKTDKESHDFLIKVIDWGTAKLVQPNELMKEKLGSPYYIAPEVLTMKYDEKCDIWSCGVILYILVCGEAPFDGDNNSAIFEKIKKGKYDFKKPAFDKVSIELKDMIKLMLNLKSADRPKASELIEHSWFKILENKSYVPTENLLNNLNSLKNFRADLKMQQAVLSFMASQLTSHEELNKLRETFQKLDKNGDGVLSKEEIIEGYKGILDDEEAILEADRIFDAVDVNHSGSIDYTEFIAATMDKRKAICKDTLKIAFKIFDKDGNGTITLDEIQEVIGAQEGINEEDWKLLVKEIDENGDGEISFEEFSTMMMKMVEKQ